MTADPNDLALRSWVDSANDAVTDFPIQNLPFGTFRPKGEASAPRIGIAIGDRIVDLVACQHDGLLDGQTTLAGEACLAPSLNRLMALGADHWSALRRRVSELLRTTAPGSLRSRVEPALVAMADAEVLLPADIGDYTDFYASVFHAANVGRMFRPDNPLLPNYKFVPIAYHGRASSIVVSGTPIGRPSGQVRQEGAALPAFGASGRLDYELEVGAFIGPGNRLGRPIPIAEAEQHVFGICLVNDWSARDIQQWEYQPLGPFLAKNFATTISPWVVTWDALEPFRVPAFARPADDPPPLPYLDDSRMRTRGGLDVMLEVLLSTPEMRARGLGPVTLSRGNLQTMYWTIGQMVTHHTSNGCNLRPGDLIATGTVSGPAKESGGCLLELTRGGADPMALPTGESRRFLENGDEVIFRGRCVREGVVSIGLGECRGVVVGIE
jgi:fumarylacetoacetase